MSALTSLLFREYNRVLCSCRNAADYNWVSAFLLKHQTRFVLVTRSAVSKLGHFAKSPRIQVAFVRDRKTVKTTACRRGNGCWWIKCHTEGSAAHLTCLRSFNRIWYSKLIIICTPKRVNMAIMSDSKARVLCAHNRTDAQVVESFDLLQSLGVCPVIKCKLTILVQTAPENAAAYCSDDEGMVVSGGYHSCILYVFPRVVLHDCRS
mmetsp:Transcript_6035/g.10753  ORF Transcript_6035/g.10753 Transcript_6035/m.10753 type:complete len:207 (-) Transcript_6035:669-1289(-)